MPQPPDVTGILTFKQRRNVLVDEGPDGAATAADRVRIAMTLQALGVQGQRDQLLSVNGAVARVAHGLQRQTVIGRLDALDLHTTPLPTDAATRLTRITQLLLPRRRLSTWPN